MKNQKTDSKHQISKPLKKFKLWVLENKVITGLIVTCLTLLIAVASLANQLLYQKDSDRFDTSKLIINQLYSDNARLMAEQSIIKQELDDAITQIGVIQNQLTDSRNNIEDVISNVHEIKTRLNLFKDCIQRNQLTLEEISATSSKQQYQINFIDTNTRLLRSELYNILEKINSIERILSHSLPHESTSNMMRPSESLVQETNNSTGFSPRRLDSPTPPSVLSTPENQRQNFRDQLADTVKPIENLEEKNSKIFTNKNLQISKNNDGNLVDQVNYNFLDSLKNTPGQKLKRFDRVAFTWIWNSMFEDETSYFDNNTQKIYGIGIPEDEESCDLQTTALCNMVEGIKNYLRDQKIQTRFSLGSLSEEIELAYFDIPKSIADKYNISKNKKYVFASISVEILNQFILAHQAAVNSAIIADVNSN